MNGDILGLIGNVAEHLVKPMLSLRVPDTQEAARVATVGGLKYYAAPLTSVAGVSGAGLVALGATQGVANRKQGASGEILPTLEAAAGAGLIAVASHHAHTIPDAGFIQLNPRLPLKHALQKGVRFGFTPGTTVSANGIEGSDIGQGALGDCFTLSPIATLTDQDKPLIEHTLGLDGAQPPAWTTGDTATNTNVSPIKVHLPGRNFTISAELPVSKTGHRVYDDPGKDNLPLWPAYLEKAVAASTKGGYAKMNKGGFPSEALSKLTGKPVLKVDPPTSATSKTPKLDGIEAALKQGAAVSAGSRFTRESSPLAKKMGKSQVFTSHAYAVLSNSDAQSAGRKALKRPQGVFIDARGTKRVQLYNPWGEYQPKPLSEGQFSNFYDMLAHTTGDSVESYEWNTKLDLKDTIAAYTPLAKKVGIGAGVAAAGTGGVLAYRHFNS